MHRHRIARGEPSIDAHALSFRRRPEQRQPPHRGRKIPRRILGIDPRLDGMAAKRNRRLIHHRQRLPRRHPKLPLHQIKPGDHLRNRMLDLKPGIHLQEEEPVAISNELYRSCPDITDRASSGDGSRPP